MSPYRRLTLQLTPLLDLLLIVIFGQYLHVLHQRVDETETAQAAVARAEDLQYQLEQSHAQRQQAVERAHAAEARLNENLFAFEQAQEDLDRALNQQRVVGELLVQLFQLPPEEVARVLDPSRTPGSQSSLAERTRLEQRFREMAQQQPGRMIEHLLSYDEIRKRCDVWRLYVDANHVVTLDVGGDTFRLRVPFDIQGNIETERFANELYNRYKALPQPKSLVIILLMYDRGTRISVTQAIREMLPPLVARMQADSAGRSRFEYADLGFKID